MTYKEIVFGIIISSLISCGQNAVSDVTDSNDSIDSEVVSLTKEQVSKMTISLGDATEQLMSSTIKVQGEIDLPPQNMISINFPMGGFLKHTKLIPGMHVSKGEVIATVNDQSIIQLQQDFLMAVAKLDLLKLEQGRQQDLKSANAGVSRNFQQIESDVKVQTITVNALKEKLKLIGVNPVVLNENNLSGEVFIKSPINGYVSKVNVNTGKYMQPTETLFELIDPDDIHVALTIFEKDLPAVTKGTSVMVYQPQAPANQYQAEVILVNKGIDEDRTATAHCHFKNFPSNLLPGMLVEGELVVRNKKATVLPDDAVVRFGNGQFIFVLISPNTYQMKPVLTGISAAGKTEVVSGLENIKPGTIVQHNAYTLLGILKNSGEEE
jgi:cobalt-zinc-cadmium efflux system membrane fusion protein